MSSLSTTTDSIFPPEIFDEILDRFAERGPEEPLSRSQIEGLKALALVCRHFSKHCQALLFEEIRDFNPDATHGKKQLSALQGIFDRNKSLLGQVRHLSISLDPPVQPGFSIDETSEDTLQTPIPTLLGIDEPLPPPYNILLQFPNLHSLGIKVTDRFKPVPFGTFLFPPQHLFYAYSQQVTLKSLVLDTVTMHDDGFWPELLVSTSLQSLTFHAILLCPHDPIMYPINHSVRHLKLKNLMLHSTRVSILSNFASLEVFEVEHIYLMDNGPSSGGKHWAVPPRLREIKINASSEDTEMAWMDCLVQNIRRSPKPLCCLQRLEKVCVPVECDADLTMLESFMSFAPSLKDLEITVNVKLSLNSTQLMKNLSHRISNFRLSLTSLTMKLRICDLFMETYTDAIHGIIAAFDTLSGCSNILASLTIDITMEPWSPDHFRSALTPWGRLSELLANAETFPMLRLVNARIVGEVGDADSAAVLLKALGGKEELDDCFSTTMEKIGNREGVLLNTNASLSCRQL